MLDPQLSLAVSVQSNKGIFALLLGAGVSKSAGVPAGWDVVRVLIRRLAHLRGAACDPDPESWFRRTFGMEPEYSDLLGQLARSAAERGRLLRSFFEPTDDEREEGLKQPTPAHRAIAELVSKGYIRVIITTNFDRLLELALADAGVAPFVISTADAGMGALPLAHAPCTIVKINGDYLDPWLRNTADELAHYDEPLERLLDRVFDEYGLIVCGWSADWDSALRAALERCSTHRFTTYWAARGEVHEKARNLITRRRATVIPISSADAFLGDLAHQVSALEQFAPTEPLAAAVAVARLKKYLSRDEYRIQTYDLLHSETERAYATIKDLRFSPQLNGSSVCADSGQRLHTIEAACQVLAALLICATHWGTESQHALIRRAFKRIADSEGPQNGVLADLNKLRFYPGLLLMYAVGLAAVVRGQYRFLNSVLELPIREGLYDPDKRAAVLLQCRQVMTPDNQARCLGGSPAGLNNHLYALLREPFREYLPDDLEYDATFDWLEYLLALVHCDFTNTRESLAQLEARDPNFTLEGPVGRFAWNPNGQGYDVKEETQLYRGQLRPPKVAALLEARFFESSGQHDDKFRQIKAGFDRFVPTARFHLGRH